MNQPSEREQEVWTAALSLPASERESFLARACDASPSMHVRLQSLLRVVDRDRTTRPKRAGDCLDDYQLLEQIGEGGCAVVYRAEQLAPMRREVALKILKVGMDSKAVLVRFDAERQVLALMDHPGIARVLDAGATPSGRPYFAMELVRGIRITDYCNQVRAGIRDRVLLLVQVCHAIQHAHYQGVVHRDIKPSNVLVTLVDGVPVVKVIDFGIAKATQGWLTEETLLTSMEQFVGTPAYVSPEQTELGSSAVDTRSDIYSLGVLLYELLTGCLPFELDGTVEPGTVHVRERIRSEEPALPSRRLEGLQTDTLVVTASLSRTSASGLVRGVRGDVDWIVQRCLEKERAHRYQTVTDMLGDLQRYLSDEPIARAPRRAVYRMQKFARRHRIACGAAAKVLVAILVAAAATALTEAQLARANKTVQDVNGFLRFAVAAQAVTARPLPQLERKDIFASMPLQWEIPSEHARAYLPLTQASVHLSAASAYRSLGDPANETLQLEKALSIYRHERQKGTAVHRIRMALFSALHARQAQRPDEIQTDEQLSKQVALATSLAFVCYRLGRFSDAKKLLEGELATAKDRRDSRGNIHPMTLEVMAILAAIYAVEGENARAESLAETVADTRRRVLGVNHYDTIKARYLLSEVHASSGKLALAADELLKATVVESGSSGPRSGVWQCRLQPQPGVDTVRPLLAEQGLAERDFDVVAAVPLSPSSCTYSNGSG